MSGPDKVQKALNNVLSALSGLEHNDQVKVLKMAVTFCEVPATQLGLEGFASTPVLENQSGQNPTADKSLVSREPTFSNRVDLTPKEFLNEKLPRTDIERVACIAYYLAHYRDTPHFKTVDINRVNTEAAQLKFSNATYAVTNAYNRGLIASAGKGTRQISAQGEHYVAALPDRNAVKQFSSRMRKRKMSKKSKKTMSKNSKRTMTKKSKRTMIKKSK